MFTPEDKMHLFSRLPNLELSYEPRLHKKVYAPLYYIIPKGPKALVWYTYWGDQNVCLLVLLNERGNYSDIKIFPSVFSNQLALGTIIYGTYFQHQRQHFFTSEQLHYYKGAALKNNNKHNNIETLLDLFQNHIGQIAYTNTSLVVGMPVITETYEEAEAQMNVLPYKTYGIGVYHMQAQQTQAPKQAQAQQTHTQAQQTHIQAQHKQVQEPKQTQAQQTQAQQTQAQQTQAQAQHQAKQTIKQPIHQQTHTQLFKVKADLAADKYHLYEPADNKLIGTALVSTYKTSVLLNSLFRHIKENANLDLLEESDDEDEFENTHLDKFVDLDKTVLMECVFSKRFQKWQPVAIKNEICKNEICKKEICKKEIYKNK